MTVKGNDAIAIATFSDWLKNLAPILRNDEKQNRNPAPCTRDVSRALNELDVIAQNSDWFIALFAPVVIGSSWLSFENPLYWFLSC